MTSTPVPAVVGLAEAIRAATEVDAARLFDVMQPELTAEEFDSCIRALVRADLVRRDGTLLIWIGSCPTT